MILEALFQGNLSPPDIVSPTDPKYKKLNQEICKLQDQLILNLSENDQKLLDDLIAKIYTAQAIESEAYFAFAFAVGMEMQKEIRNQLTCKIEEPK